MNYFSNHPPHGNCHCPSQFNWYTGMGLLDAMIFLLEVIILPVLSPLATSIPADATPATNAESAMNIPQQQQHHQLCGSYGGTRMNMRGIPSCGQPSSVRNEPTNFHAWSTLPNLTTAELATGEFILLVCSSFHHCSLNKKKRKKKKKKKKNNNIYIYIYIYIYTTGLYAAELLCPATVSTRSSWTPCMTTRDG